MQIRRAVIDAIVEHARREWPRECCGLLIGGAELISESREARNARESEVAFLVDPADHFAAIRRARAAGTTVVGAYHSHPRSPATPSPADIREANDPQFVHVIVSLAGAEPQLGGFLIREGSAVSIPLLTVDDDGERP